MALAANLVADVLLPLLLGALHSSHAAVVLHINACGDFSFLCCGACIIHLCCILHVPLICPLLIRRYTQAPPSACLNSKHHRDAWAHVKPSSMLLAKVDNRQSWCAGNAIPGLLANSQIGPRFAKHLRTLTLHDIGVAGEDPFTADMWLQVCGLCHLCELAIETSYLLHHPIAMCRLQSLT